MFLLFQAFSWQISVFQSFTCDYVEMMKSPSMNWGFVFVGDFFTAKSHENHHFCTIIWEDMFFFQAPNNQLKVDWWFGFLGTPQITNPFHKGILPRNL